MNYQTNYSPRGQTIGFLGLALAGGVGWGLLGSYPLSAGRHFLLGSIPGLIGAIGVRYRPITLKRQLDCPVVEVTPKRGPFIEISDSSRRKAALLKPASAITLYAGALLSAPPVISDHEKIAIRVPVDFGSQETLLLRGIRYLPKGNPSPTSWALLFAGNGNSCLAMTAIAHIYLRKGIGVQLVDIRGYGDSEGYPSAEGTQLDVMGMVEAVKKLGNKFYFHGVSLGAHHAAVGAAYTAEYYGTEAMGGCIMEQPFGKLAGPVGSHPLFRPLAGLAQSLFPYDNIDVVSRLVKSDRSLVTKLRIFRGRRDIMMNPKRVDNNSQSPHLDPNVEPIFQAIQGQYSEITRDSVIRDNDNPHCMLAEPDEWVGLLA